MKREDRTQECQDLKEASENVRALNTEMFLSMDAPAPQALCKIPVGAVRRILELLDLVGPSDELTEGLIFTARTYLRRMIEEATGEPHAGQTTWAFRWEGDAETRTATTMPLKEIPSTDEGPIEFLEKPKRKTRKGKK